MPLQIQYNQEEPNSLSNWMERWTFSRFWNPPSQPKKTADSKIRAKRSSYTMVTGSGRQKRSVRRNSPANVNTTQSNITSEPDKPKRILKKVTASAYSVQDPPQSELERVKRSLRKVTSSYAEIGANSQTHNVSKVADSSSDTPAELGTNDSIEKPEKTKIDITLTPEPKSEIEIAPECIIAEEPVDLLVGILPAESNSLPSLEKEESISVINGELGAKEEQTSNENQKTSKRRSSFSAKSEYVENSVQNSPTVPSYMQATKSAKAKLRGQTSPRLGSDTAEKDEFTRRHSLPSPTNGKVILHSPRTQRILQASGKGSIRSDRLLFSSRDANERLIQVEWRR